MTILRAVHYSKTKKSVPVYENGAGHYSKKIQGCKFCEMQLFRLSIHMSHSLFPMDEDSGWTKKNPLLS